MDGKYIKSVYNESLDKTYFLNVRTGRIFMILYFKPR